MTTKITFVGEARNIIRTYSSAWRIKDVNKETINK